MSNMVNVKNENGWKSIREIKSPIDITARVELSDIELLYNKNYDKKLAIVDALYKNLMKEFVSNFDIPITEHKNFTRSSVYEAKVRFVPLDVKYSEIFVNKYIVDGVEFSKEQIEQAIKEQFPEYFIWF